MYILKVSLNHTPASSGKPKRCKYLEKVLYRSEQEMPGRDFGVLTVVMHCAVTCVTHTIQYCDVSHTNTNTNSRSCSNVSTLLCTLALCSYMYCPWTSSSSVLGLAVVVSQCVHAPVAMMFWKLPTTGMLRTDMTCVGLL